MMKYNCVILKYVFSNMCYQLQHAIQPTFHKWFFLDIF